MGADLSNDGKTETSSRRAHVVKRLRRARNLIEQEFDRSLTLADIAAAAFMSEAHFVRQFRGEFGITPYRYLTERRLIAARSLLEETDLPVTDIVPAAGFGNRSAFSRLFKSRFGLSPQAYRNVRRRRRRSATATVLPPGLGLVTLLLALALPAGVLAQDAEPAAQPAPPPPCASEAHREFDFWIGSWEVYANEQLAGHNVITASHGGCVLQENWKSAQGTFTGSSLNLYDAASDSWHQSWADSSGTLLLLDGGLQDGNMVLKGERPARDGTGMVTHRITWTPNEDGTVRQQWDASRDGESWQSLFDGIYRRSD